MASLAIDVAGSRSSSWAEMHNGSQTLDYEVVPGSGHGALEGISGTFQLTIEHDGTHRYEL